MRFSEQVDLGKCLEQVVHDMIADLGNQNGDSHKEDWLLDSVKIHSVDETSLDSLFLLTPESFLTVTDQNQPRTATSCWFSYDGLIN